MNHILTFSLCLNIQDLSKTTRLIQDKAKISNHWFIITSQLSSVYTGFTISAFSLVFNHTVFVDLWKSFNTANHSCFYINYPFIGLDFASFSWFKNFLSDRYKCVKMCNIHSSGVCFGSFTVYMNVMLLFQVI